MADLDVSLVTSPPLAIADLGNEAQTPYGIWFKPDGTRLFLLDFSDSGLKQYNLSTPWDPTTAVYELSRSFSYGFCRGLYMTPDGLNAFTVSDNSNIPVRLALNTAWDLADGVTRTQNTSYTVSNREGLALSGDGTKFFTEQSGNLLEYALSTPFDLATFDNVIVNNRSIDDGSSPILGSPEGIQFSSDGLQLFTSSAGADTSRGVAQFSLDAPWDITTLRFVAYQPLDFPVAPNGTPYALFVAPDAGKLFLVYSNIDMWVFELPVAPAVSTLDAPTFEYIPARMIAQFAWSFSDINEGDTQSEVALVRRRTS